MGFFDWFSSGKKKREDFSKLTEQELEEKARELRMELLEDYSLNKVKAPLAELKGLNGLRNLGNTCYMNSALQCLSNTKELTEFLLEDKWLRDINTVNAIGSRGRLLCAYSELLRELWNGEVRDYAVPRRFKKQLGLENLQFEGYEQHDSQEFLSYLVDNLHEDLNKIIKKPYIETKDFDPRVMDLNKYALQCEKNFRMRNKSFLTDLLYGQFQSSIECPDCGHISITFDAFNMISVPLNSKSKFSIYMMRQTEMFKISKMSFYVHKEATLTDVRRAIEQGKGYKLSNFKFYRFGAPFDRYGRVKEEETYQMRRIEKDEDNYIFSDLYEDDHAFPFLIDDGFPEFVDDHAELKTATTGTSEPMSDLGGGEFVVLNFALEWNHKCQDLVKPVKVPSRCRIQTLYKIVFEIVAESCPKTYGKKKFSTCFEGYRGDEMESGTENNWPFMLKYKRKLLSKFGKKEEISLENYDEMLIVVNSVDVQDSSNLRDSLDISKVEVPGHLNLYDCLSSFTRNETLDADNTWYCNACHGHKQARKNMLLSKLPKILIIHLKRFSRTEYRFSKNSAKVDFPLQGLDLSDYMIKGRSSSKYDLYGVINHMGGMGGGHYTSYVKTPAAKDVWVEFDDSQVDQINKSQVVSKSAYVLFYRRRD